MIKKKKKLIGKTIGNSGKLRNVRGYLLRDRIVFASKNTINAYTRSRRNFGRRTKIESRHFLPGQGAHKSFASPCSSRLLSSRFQRNREDATLSKNAEIIVRVRDA